MSILTRFPLFTLVIGLSLVHPCAGSPGIFTVTGDLFFARSGHTANLLPNGKVLVAGGVDSGLPELYDPSAGTWSSTGGVIGLHIGRSATSLQNGNVLMAGGGANDGSLTSAIAGLYVSAGGHWKATGSLNTARAAHTATLLFNGKVLVAGGYDENLKSLASAELYDMATGTWSVTGSLKAARFSHTATLLPNGKVLVTGGVNSNSNSDLTSAEIYDVATGAWTVTDSLKTARHLHTATLLQNGMVLVAAGADSANHSLASAEIYDQALGSWSATSNLKTQRINHTATLLNDGRVLVAGGGGAIYPDAELYDPIDGSWNATSSLNINRAAHTATLLPDGKVLVAGGANGANLASAELYDPNFSSGKLLNISTRVKVETGADVAIGGFIIAGGTTAKTLVIRTIGPSLANANPPVTGRLADPLLQLHEPDGSTVTNNNWKTNSVADQAIIVASGLDQFNGKPISTLESVIVATLPPKDPVVSGSGEYTAIVSGAGGGSGIALVEVYDLDDATAAAELADISTRGFVGTGDNVLIGGIIIGPLEGNPPASASVVVRAIGPSLANAVPPVLGFLVDPFLKLFDANGNTIAENDDWQDDPIVASELRTEGLAPTNASESAITATLEAGNYTAIVTGTNDTTGVGLVEAFHISTSISEGTQRGDRRHP